MSGRSVHATTLATVCSVYPADAVTLVGGVFESGAAWSQRAVIGTYAYSDNAIAEAGGGGESGGGKAAKGAACRKGNLMTVVIRTVMGEATCKVHVENIGEDMEGVLDVKSGKHGVFVGGAKGGVLWFQEGIGKGVEIARSEKGVLSVDVGGGREKGREFLVGGGEGGDVGVWTMGEGAWEGKWRKNVHGDSVWCVCKDEDDNGFWSGGDDGKVIWRDVDGSERGRWGKLHGGIGVTSLKKEKGDWKLWSGGYDDVVRVWDVRKIGKDTIAECEVGGGVWDMDIGGKDNNVLVSAIYDGYKVLQWQNNQLELLIEYKEHASLAYAAKWLNALPLPKGQTMVLSASFYDSQLHVWLLEDGPPPAQ